MAQVLLSIKSCAAPYRSGPVLGFGNSIPSTLYNFATLRLCGHSVVLICLVCLLAGIGGFDSMLHGSVNVVFISDAANDLSCMNTGIL